MSAATSNSSGGGVASILSAAASPVGLVANLIGSIFGGSSEPAAVKPSKYLPPAAVNYSFGLSANSEDYQPVDGGSSGLSRIAGNSGSSGSNIVIQVQAMDSRSFLDHSNEIAEAVRKALLEAHPLRDAMTE